ncbi:MAG: hypothetical protein SF066_13725 [Thermoanaerobaculia bacterium]|nr:hypothetical protein [Thermoanaerobaculia bacterium]
MVRRVSLVCLVLFLGLSTAAAVAQPIPPGECTGGGSASAHNCGDWSGWAKTLPGTICTMNVGNADFLAELVGGYKFKLRSCSEANARVGMLEGTSCDVVNIIELNSDEQCACACDPDPFNFWCRNAKYPYDPERCNLCRGCQPPDDENDTGSCVDQARVFCPEPDFEVSCTNAVMNEISVGCDCMCRRKWPCAGPLPRCERKVVRATDSRCDPGNYATCQRCDYDGDGSFDFGSCVAHPSHCNGVEGFIDRDDCFYRCNTPVVQGAAQFIASAAVQTISGDFNCYIGDPGWFYNPFGECPWAQNPPATDFGLEICPVSQGTTITGQIVDFVLSNSCGCSEQQNLGSTGDHQSIALVPSATTWFGPAQVGTSAVSASNCADPGQSNTSDFLGGAVACPTALNGQILGSCRGDGVTSTTLRYTALVEACQPSTARPPKVLVCETATTSAGAFCSGEASGTGWIRVVNGDAIAGASASCSDTSARSVDAETTTLSTIETPTVVDLPGVGRVYRIERAASRDRRAGCSAPSSPPTPCTVEPVHPSSMSFEAGAFVPMEQDSVCVHVDDPSNL